MIASTILTRELVALALTLPVFAQGFHLIWRTKKIRRWRDAKGKILSFRKKREGIKTTVVIHYSYLAQGILLKGNSITICDWIFAAGLFPVQKLADLFPAGKEVTVYFDESHPEKCVLQKNGYFVPASIFVAGVIAEICLAWFIAEGNTLPPGLRPEIIHF